MSAHGEPQCLTCRFWHPPDEDGAGPGECRHRSPRAVEDHRSRSWRSQWPPTWPAQWCGNWRPDEAALALPKEYRDV